MFAQELSNLLMVSERKILQLESKFMLRSWFYAHVGGMYARPVTRLSFRRGKRSFFGGAKEKDVRELLDDDGNPGINDSALCLMINPVQPFYSRSTLLLLCGSALTFLF